MKDKKSNQKQPALAQVCAQEALLAGESKYRTLIENLPQKIFLKDRNSAYISCNEKYARDLKIKPDEIAGKTDYDFYPKELAEKYRADDKRIMQEGKVEEIEEKYIQDGKEVAVHTVKTPVKGESGDTAGILGIFWDITERRRIEEERKKFEEQLVELFEEVKQDAKARLDFITKISQELKTSLNSILGFAELLDTPESAKFNQKQKEYVRGILEGGRNLSALINNTLEIAKIQSGSTELNITKVNLKELLNQAKIFWNKWAGARSIKLGLEISPDFPDEIDGDAEKIKQLLFSFLSNALKFTPDGGEVIIEAKRISGGEVKIAVLDNGSGIKKEEQEKLFSPFMRLDNTKPGAGLELFLSKRIVKLWNGNIGVVSPPEGKVKGSRFYFTLYARGVE